MNKFLKILSGIIGKFCIKFSEYFEKSAEKVFENSAGISLKSDFENL